MTEQRAIKIALVTTFYPPFSFGGDGIYVRRLAHALARAGCDVHIIHDADAYRTLAPKGGDLTPLDEPAGVTVHRMESSLGALSPVLTQQFGRPLANGKKLKALLNDGFDITHFHNISLVGGPGILSMGSGIKLYTAHEHWLVCPMHILWRHGREVCDKRECFKCQLKAHRPPQAWRQTGYLHRQAEKVDAFIALSQSSADNHAAFGFRQPMRILPTFIPDLDVSKSPTKEQTGPWGKRPYALFVGRLEKIKGLQDLMPLFVENPVADLVIAGDGEYETELRQMAGDSKHIHFLGRLASDELDILYRDALAVLTPSACYEVFPLVALEAFRASTPIIARNLGPYPEIAEASQAGLLFETKEEAHEALEKLASDAALQAKMGQSGRQAYEKNWSEKPALKAYFRLISETANAKGLTRLSGESDRLAQILST